MKFIKPFLALASLASATTYSLSVYAPGTAVHEQPLDAAGFSFYTGSAGPATYCPSSIVANCPNETQTLVYSGLAAMAVEVPGGQQIYIAPNGLVSYTQAHSMFMPQNSTVGGFFNQTIVSSCAPTVEVLNFLSTDGSDQGGVYLCPDDSLHLNTTKTYFQLYAGVTGFSQTNCTRAHGILQTGHEAQFGAWQYT